jgi:hypothetical protein
VEEFLDAPSSLPIDLEAKNGDAALITEVMAKEEELANAKCGEGADGTVDVADGNVDDDSAPTKAPKTGLGLKLDTDDVLKEWSGKGSMFAEGSMPESPESAAEVRVSTCFTEFYLSLCSLCQANLIQKT